MTNEKQWQLLVLILRKISESKGISQQEVADRTGLKRQNVSRMFNLQRCPNLSTFVLVAKSIGVNFFFEDKAGDTELNVIFEQAMTELGRRPDKLETN